MIDDNAAAASDRAQEPAPPAKAESPAKPEPKSSTRAADSSKPANSSDETKTAKADQAGETDTKETPGANEAPATDGDDKPLENPGETPSAGDIKPAKQPDEIGKPVEGNKDVDPTKPTDAASDDSDGIKGQPPAVLVATTAPTPAPVPAPPTIAPILARDDAPASAGTAPDGIQPPVLTQPGNIAPQATLAGPKNAAAKDGDQTSDSKLDVKADAAARNALPADIHHGADKPVGADKPIADVSLSMPKPGVDAAQPLTLTTPAPQTAAAANANAAAAPTAQPAAQPAAVPLAGVAIEIASRALAGKNHFAIRLDPPELGRIEVHLDVHRDGRVTSHLVADRKDTLDLFRRDVAGLERALQDAGLKTSDNGLQFSLRDQQNGWQQQRHQPESGHNVRVIANDGLSTIEAAQPGARLSYRGGGLDIRV